MEFHAELEEEAPSVYPAPAADQPAPEPSLFAFALHAYSINNDLPHSAMIPPLKSLLKSKIIAI